MIDFYKVELDLQGDIRVIPLGGDKVLVFHYNSIMCKWSDYKSGVMTVEDVNSFLGTDYSPLRSNQLIPSRYHLRQIRPDKGTVKEWLRVWGNDMESKTEGCACKAYQIIVSICIATEEEDMHILDEIWQEYMNCRGDSEEEDIYSQVYTAVKKLLIY